MRRMPRCSLCMRDLCGRCRRCRCMSDLLRGLSEELLNISRMNILYEYNICLSVADAPKLPCWRIHPSHRRATAPNQQQTCKMIAAERGTTATTGNANCNFATAKASSYFSWCLLEYNHNYTNVCTHTRARTRIVFFLRE